MKKLDYLKIALNNSKYKNKNWIISILSVFNQKEGDYTDYDLKHDQTGFYYVLEGVWNKIEDGEPNTPLFQHKDNIKVTSELCPNALEPVDSTIGNLLFNWIALVYPFGTKIPYVKGKVNIGKIEQKLADMFEDETEDKLPNKVYPSEFNKYIEGLVFISSLSFLFVWASSEKSITSAPGMYEYKEKLIKEYGDKLNDPSVFAEFESKLIAYDDAYLKDDPANGVVLSGKVKAIARKRLTITTGIEGGINPSDSLPILKSLEEGWDKDVDEIVARFNISRAASYSRGKETEKGGEVQKIILRTASNFKIAGINCGSKKGIKRILTDKMKQQTINRYIIGIHENGKDVIFKEPILITEDNIKEYMYKEIIVRSVGYCLNEGDTICITCAGSNYKDGESTTLTLTDISHSILMSRMKAVHGSALSVTKLELKEVLS